VKAVVSIEVKEGEICFKTGAEGVVGAGAGVLCVVGVGFGVKEREIVGAT